MNIIKGPIEFKANEELPQKFKDWIKENGIKTPFDSKTTTFTKKPDWVNLK